jgi:hypothetical protein
MTSKQCRNGRVRLGWSARRLAQEAGVAYLTVREFETVALRRARPATVVKLRAAMERAGIVFLVDDLGPGVMLRAA